MLKYCTDSYLGDSIFGWPKYVKYDRLMIDEKWLCCREGLRRFEKVMLSFKCVRV